MGKYVCAICGSDDIQVKKWVNPNDNRIIERDEQDRSCWCENCEETTFYEDKTVYLVQKKLLAIAEKHQCKLHIADFAPGCFHFEKCNIPLLADVRIACEELGIPRKCIESSDSWGYIGIDLDEIDEKQ